MTDPRRARSSLVRKGAVLLACVVFFVLEASAEPPVEVQMHPRDYREGEALVRFAPGCGMAAQDGVLRSVEADGSDEATSAGVKLIRWEGQPVPMMIARLNADPCVDYAEPNFLYRIQTVPNDPDFELQWALRNLGQTGGTPGADIRATNAWDVFTGSGAVVVALIDTGLDIAHVDLAPNLFRNDGEIPDNNLDDDGNGYVDDVTGWDFISDDPVTQDENGHGTHLAGTIGASGNNGLGVAGVNWHVGLLPLKFANPGGFGATIDAVESIDYAIAIGAQIILTGWAGPSYSQSLFDAVERAAEAGVIVVAAAGNSNPGVDIDAIPFYPAAFDLPNIVSVAASDHHDALWIFSNFGAEAVDLAAPGVQVHSTLPGGTYGTRNGTSAAAAHVAGTLALQLGRFTDQDGFEAKRELLEHSVVLPDLGDRVAGNRRLSAFLPIADPDELSPDAITDLDVTEIESWRIDLSWTATGDDGSIGTAAVYEIRYSEDPIDHGSFESAMPWSTPPDPAPAGTPESLRITGLVPMTTYHFAIRAIDELGNVSPISNVAKATTLGSPQVDVAPPFLSARATSGETTGVELTVGNTGLGEYVFEGVSRRSAASDVRLLVLHQGISIETLLDELRALSPSIHVSEFVGTGVPELDDLLRHDAVLLASLGPWPDPTGLGDVLADYADLGGGVVLSLFSTARGWEVGGRFLDEEYYPVTLSVAPAGASILAPVNEPHPITDGVGDVFVEIIGRLEAVRGASIVARWTHGFPAIVANDANVVVVNAFLEDGGWTGDLPKLIRGAAAWSSRHTTWFRLEPNEGQIPVGTNQAFEARFDARHLFAGRFDSSLILRGNDLDDPERTVPVSFEVFGEPRLETTPTEFDFGVVLVGLDRTTEIVIRNSGTDRLAVSGVSSSDASFLVDAAGFDLEPLQEQRLEIRFVPQTVGVIDAVMTIASDDPGGPREISVRGEGASPPVVNFEPTSIDIELDVGDIVLPPLALLNSGGTELNFRLFVEVAAEPGQTVTFADDFEHGSLDGWVDAGGDGTHEITARIAANGSRFSYHAYGASVGRFDGITRELDTRHPGYVGFHIRSGSTTTGDGNVVLRDDALNPVIWFSADQSGYFLLNSEGPSESDFEYEALRWYHVELRNIDFDAGRLDYFVDGRAIGLGVRLIDVGPAHHISRIDLFNFNTDSEAWWDDLFVSDTDPPDGLSVMPTAGSIDPGGRVDFDVTVDAVGTIEREIDAQIVVESNDPFHPTSFVPIHVRINGTPEIDVAPDRLEFGTVWAGLTDRLVLSVSNPGTGPLDVTQVVPGEETFTVDPTSVVIEPGSTRNLQITWSPHTPGSVSTELTIHSNAGEQTVPLSGTAIRGPDAVVEPSSVLVDQPPGTGSTSIIALHNAGDLELSFEAHVSEIDGTPPPTEVLTFEEDFENDDDEWTSTSVAGTDLWHPTTRESSSPIRSWWCGDEIRGDYGVGGRISAALISAPIDLGDGSAAATLRFNENFVTESAWDACMVDLSPDDGATWIPLRGSYGEAPSGTSGGWVEESIDLGAFAGIVRIRFYFETFDGANNAFPGWFVDDVRVSLNAPPWISIEPEDGRVEPGGRAEIELRFEALESRPPGAYRGVVVIDSDDPIEPRIRIPATMRAGSYAEVVIEPAALEAALPPGSTRIARKTVLIRNEGTGPLVWRATPGANTAIHPESGEIGAGGDLPLEIEIRADDLDPGDHSIEVRLETNDPNRPTIILPIELHLSEIVPTRLTVDFTPKFAQVDGTVEIAFELPREFDVESIVIPTVEASGVLPLDHAVVHRDLDRNGIRETILQFDRAAIEQALGNDASAELTLVGEVAGVTWFRGSVWLRGVSTLGR